MYYSIAYSAISSLSFLTNYLSEKDVEQGLYYGMRQLLEMFLPLDRIQLILSEIVLLGKNIYTKIFS